MVDRPLSRGASCGNALALRLLILLAFGLVTSDCAGSSALPREGQGYGHEVYSEGATERPPSEEIPLNEHREQEKRNR